MTNSPRLLSSEVWDYLLWFQFQFGGTSFTITVASVSVGM